MTELRLEKGKKYNCADGTIVAIENEEDNTDDNVFVGNNYHYYFSNGHHIGSGWNKEKDLISEYIEEDWKPNEGDEFWFINTSYECFATIYSREGDWNLIATGNYYQTKELCQAAADKKLNKETIEFKLRKIAKRLNAGVEIDWNNRNQTKYNISYDYRYCEIQINSCYSIKRKKIYCLSYNFKNEAIKEIGKEELTKYLTGEYDE